MRSNWLIKDGPTKKAAAPTKTNEKDDDAHIDSDDWMNTATTKTMTTTTNELAGAIMIRTQLEGWGEGTPVPNTPVTLKI